eukprot:scaffold12311_cov50-Cyclotella_meneghiniana.AAC.1
MVINEKQTMSRGGIIRFFIGRCPRHVVLFELLSQWLFVGHCPRHEVTEYIRSNEHRFKHCNIDALVEALPLVFRSNYFKFGDLYCQQKSGTAMGTPPAPPWATITFAIHEDKILQKWSELLPFYLRFIDDGIGVWRVDAC